MIKTLAFLQINILFVLIS